MTLCVHCGVALEALLSFCTGAVVIVYIEHVLSSTTQVVSGRALNMHCAIASMFVCWKYFRECGIQY